MVPPLLWACSSCTCCGNGSSVGGSCRGEGRKRTNRDRSSGTSRKCSSQRYGAGGDDRKGLGGCASQAGARVEVPARKRRLHGNPAARVRLQPQRELLDRRAGADPESKRQGGDRGHLSAAVPAYYGRRRDLLPQILWIPQRNVSLSRDRLLCPTSPAAMRTRV